VAATLLTLAVFGLLARSEVKGFKCRNFPIAEAVSPDGAQRGVSFVRDCGRRTPRSTQVSLLAPREVLGNQYGNIFVAELERQNEIELRWSAPDVFEIRVGTIRRAYRADPGKGRTRVLYGRLYE
jgi:hypothetical protein